MVDPPRVVKQPRETAIFTVFRAVCEARQDSPGVAKNASRISLRRLRARVSA